MGDLWSLNHKEAQLCNNTKVLKYLNYPPPVSCLEKSEKHEISRYNSDHEEHVIKPFNPQKWKYISGATSGHHNSIFLINHQCQL